MKKTKLCSVLLAVAFVFTAFSFAGNDVGSVSTVNATTGTEMISEINGISLTQKGVTGGGIMLEQYALSTLELSAATYLAISYYNPTNVPWPFYFICQQNDVFIYLKENEEYKVYDDDFSLLETKAVTYSAIAPTASGTGWIVLPASVFEGMGTVQALYITLPVAAEAQIGVTQLHFGKVGYYTEATPNLETDMITLTDFSIWTEEWFVGRVTDPAGVDVQIVGKPKAIVCDFGDVRILEDFSTGYSEDAMGYNAAMSSKVDPAVGGLNVEKYVETVQDGTALKLTVVEPIENKRDDYAAITFTAKNSVYKWSQWLNDDGKLEGITYFISNLSASEVTLCFEIDEYDPEQNVAEDYRGERWSVGLGGRIILYDTVKNEQSLIHANPMVSVPAGFTGWVRIPVSCFTKAAWCTWGNSTFDKTRIAQFTIAAYGPINMGNSFVIDSVGLYYNKTVVQSIFSDNGDSLPDNLGLNK